MAVNPPRPNPASELTTEESGWAHPRRPPRNWGERLAQDPEFVVGLVLVAGFVIAAAAAIYQFGNSLFTLNGTLGAFGGQFRPMDPAAPSSTHPFGVLWIAVTNPQTGTGWAG